MPKVQNSSRKKRCHYCAVEVSACNWSKHCKSQRHLAREHSVVRRSNPDSEDEFELAQPTVIPQPGPSAEDSEPEVLAILAKQNKIPSLASKKSGSGASGDRPDKTGSAKVKRDKASLNFLVTAHKVKESMCMLGV